MKNSTKPDISVIMGVYNGEKYIYRALLSLLAQSYQNIEIILVDDGSTDKTCEIISNIDDSRIVFIQQNNMGLTKSLNKALSLARGRFIARHDADDFSIYSRFERQMGYLNRHPDVKMLGSSCYIQSSRNFGIISTIYDYPETHEEILNALPYFNPFVHGSMLIDKEILLKNDGYNESYRYVQDYELWTRLVPQVCSANFGYPLYVRSVHDESSELSVDKTPIFNEIRDRYRAKISHSGGGFYSPQRSIELVDHFPIFSKGGGNLGLSMTYWRMGRCGQKIVKDQLKYRAASLVYCPWFFFQTDAQA